MGVFFVTFCFLLAWPKLDKDDKSRPAATRTLNDTLASGYISCYNRLGKTFSLLRLDGQDLRTRASTALDSGGIADLRLIDNNSATTYFVYCTSIALLYCTHRTGQLISPGYIFDSCTSYDFRAWGSAILHNPISSFCHRSQALFGWVTQLTLRFRAVYCGEYKPRISPDTYIMSSSSNLYASSSSSSTTLLSSVMDVDATSDILAQREQARLVRLCDDNSVARISHITFEATEKLTTSGEGFYTIEVSTACLLSYSLSCWCWLDAM